MVAYYILLVLVVGAIAFGVYKSLLVIYRTIKIPDPWVPTLGDKSVELRRLKERLTVLGVEVKITETLIHVDEEIAVLTRRLEKAENQRTSEQD